MRRHGLEKVLHPLTDSYQAVTSFLFLQVVLLLLSPLLCIPGMLFLFGGTQVLAANISSTPTSLLQQLLQILSCDIQPAITWRLTKRKTNYGKCP